MTFESFSLTPHDRVFGPRFQVHGIDFLPKYGFICPFKFMGINTGTGI